MDFMSRTPTQPQPQPARMPAPEPAEPPRAPGGRHHPKEDLLTVGSRLGTNALLFIVALLVAAVVWLIYSSAPTPQNKLVDQAKLQAVFLNTGQVYFGHVTLLNRDYLVLNSVYYLQSSNSAANSSTNSGQNISLVKLGCELHKPYDAMYINTTEVTFWENLQADGQVAKAVTQFQQQNPNGQKCSNQPAPNSSNLQNQSTTKP